MSSEVGSYPSFIGEKIEAQWFKVIYLRSYNCEELKW